MTAVRAERFEPDLRSGLALFEGVGVVCATARVVAAERPAYPEEAALVRHAVAKRRNEFAAGRRAAHAALERLNVPPAPLLTKPDRSAAWPDGIVGSISHTGSLAISVAAPQGALLSVGVDLEGESALDRDLLAMVCVPEELTVLDVWSAAIAHDAGKLVFSAKEAFYKAYHAITGVFLDYRDVRIVLAPRGSGFTAEVRAAAKPDPARHGLSGAGLFFRAEGHVFTLYVQGARRGLRRSQCE